MTQLKVPHLIILVGIPCSGKTTFAETKEFTHSILSKDKLRNLVFGRKYKQNVEDEKRITKIYWDNLEMSKLYGLDIIIDNPNCKQKQIDSIVKYFKESDYEIEILYFNITLSQALWRNFFRRLKTGKYISKQEIKNMKIEFDNLYSNRQSLPGITHSYVT